MTAPTSPWPVAVFAHNEAAAILACLDSLARAAEEHPLAIHILANGCTDATLRVAHDYAARHAGVAVVEIALGDKSNAWNVYVHEHAPDAALHIFVDGDVRADPGALRRLAEILAANPNCNAAGAMPSGGRDRDGVRQRMAAYGRLAGGLYALSGGFVARLRREQVRLPLGFIGEDWLVACLAKEDLTPGALSRGGDKVICDAAATFSFRSLDLARPGDWRAYARRLVRYALREHQFAMLQALWAGGIRPKLPASVDQLYAIAPALPRYAVRASPRAVFDAIAVAQIRRRARR